MTPPELRAACAQKLLANSARAAGLTAFVGLDGFVDEILHVVDQREDAGTYQRLPTIARFAERVAAAAGRSGNLELVPQITKLGGNGPIMANALASLGLKVTYLGTLGYPNLHPVFRDFAARAEVHSIAEPGTTDALEFEDGKIMLGKHASLKEVTWDNIQARYGLEKFTAKLNSADLVAFVNWTMLPYMSDIWEAILRDVCPALTAPRRLIFFDLADPEKRAPKDILHALDLIARFGRHFRGHPRPEREGGPGPLPKSAASNPNPPPRKHWPKPPSASPPNCASAPSSSILSNTPWPSPPAKSAWPRDLRRPGPKSPPARATISTPAFAWENCWDLTTT